MTLRVLALIALLACSCSKAVDEDQPKLRPLGLSNERDLRTKQWSEALRAAHASATGSLEDKQRALEALRGLAVVPSTLSPEDAAMMRRSILASAARVALDLGRNTDAWLLIHEGLALAGRDPFRTQLLLLDVEVQRAFGHTNGQAAAERAARLDLGLD